jgi:hypothetical protein
MPSLYICMHCPQTDLLCALCVKDSHTECPDSHIIQSSDLKRIFVRPPEIDICAEFSKVAKQAAEQNAARIVQEFNGFKSKANESLNFVEYIDEDFYSLERIEGLKSQYSISVDKQTGKLRFEPRVYTDNLVTEKVSRQFKSSLQKTVENFASQVEALNLNIYHYILDVRRFQCHSNLEIAKLDSDPSSQTIKILKKENDGQRNYAYLTTPLTSNFFTINLELVSPKEETDEPVEFQLGVCQFPCKPDWANIPLGAEAPRFHSIHLNNGGFNSNPQEHIGVGVNKKEWTDGKTKLHVSFVRDEKLRFFDDAGSFQSVFKLKPDGEYFLYVMVEKPALRVTISE